MDILKTEIAETGFKLTYAKPLSEETRQDLASKYEAEQWRYNATAASAVRSSTRRACRSRARW